MKLLVKILCFLQIIISGESTEKKESLGTTNCFNEGQHSHKFILWDQMIY